MRPRCAIIDAIVGGILLTCLSFWSSPAMADDLKQPASRLLALTEECRAQIDRASRTGLIDLAPVNLPTTDVGGCNHLGWPIATMTQRTLVVMHRRIPGHKAAGAGIPDSSMSYGVVLTSRDGGKTWSKPYDLRDCMLLADRSRGGLVPLSHRSKFDPKNKSPLGYKVHLHSIGTDADGAVVAINNHGVFRSEDAGRSWKHFSKALRDDTFPHEIINLGPRLLHHEQFGLLAFGNWFGEVDSYHKLSNQLVALSSRDGGATWKVEEHDVGFPQYEPAAILHDKRFHFVTRDQTKVRAHRQIDWLPKTSPVVLATNLEDSRLVDTVDFSFNPVTRRFEVVRSERHRMELWLWSMDPADWETGKWRRECRLLARKGDFYSTADGFHPAGTVIDVPRGVQHVFFYSGHPNGPAGVFRLTRTLNTPALVASQMVAVPAGDRIVPQQETPPDGAIHDVHDRHVVRRKHLSPSEPRHCFASFTVQTQTSLYSSPAVCFQQSVCQRSCCVPVPPPRALRSASHTLRQYASM